MTEMLVAGQLLALTTLLLQDMCDAAKSFCSKVGRDFDGWATSLKQLQLRAGCRVRLLPHSWFDEDEEILVKVRDTVPDPDMLMLVARMEAHGTAAACMHEGKARLQSDHL